MLINLGLGSMIGTMTGITTPILDAFKIRKEILCGEQTVFNSTLFNWLNLNMCHTHRLFFLLFLSGLLYHSLPVRPAVCAALRELLRHHV